MEYIQYGAVGVMIVVWAVAHFGTNKSHTRITSNTSDVPDEIPPFTSGDESSDD